MPTRTRITCASRRIDTRDTAPTTRSMTTLIVATAPWLVTLPAASLMAELFNAAPRAVSMNGVYAAVKLAFAARMYVKAMQIEIPAIAPRAGEMMRERYTYSPPARGIA